MLLPLLQSPSPALTLPVWVQVISPIIAFGALFFTGLGFFRQARVQRFQNYLNAMSGFVGLQKMMIEKPALHALYEFSKDDLGKSYEDMNQDERALVHYCDMLIALLETVWYAAQKKWIPEDEWNYWKKWAHKLHNSPYLRWSLKWADGKYHESFLESLKPVSDHFRPRTRS